MCLAILIQYQRVQTDRQTSVTTKSKSVIYSTA